MITFLKQSLNLFLRSSHWP